MTTIGILLYENAEVLDFAGPFEVLHTASRLHTREHQPETPLWDVVLIGRNSGPIHARYGFTVHAQYGFADHPPLDVLILPGGIHTQAQHDPGTIAWIQRTAANTRWLASVCTGAFLLAQAGLLTGHPTTTHWEDIDDLRREFPTLDVRENTAWVESGNVLCSAGISAGIEMSLHLVTRLHSKALAIRTARQMEYHWQNAHLSQEA